MRLTRRGFLTQVGQAGGFSATLIAMQSLGMMPAKAEPAPSIAAQPGMGKGVKVVVLGGGIAGLVAAYELRALGYETTLLEARERPGGRNWTVRGGDTVKFVDGSSQTCAWEKGHYQNFGPARLPSIHKTILDYCKKLGVELQVEVNTSRSSYLQNDAANGGKPIIQRQAVNDTRGHVSELLMKCVNAGALDTEVGKEDRERMLAFLRQYGSLDSAGKYAGGDRAGYKVLPGAGDQVGVPSDPIDMHTLLDESFWSGVLFEETFDMQATMFQPVGGMDRIPFAFGKALGDVVQYNSPVTEIRKTAKGVRVGYTQGGAAKTIEADFCICAMPLTILKKTPNDFAAPFKKVIDECVYVNAYKVAWESRRFWEQDYNVYGGLEFVMAGCSPIWFPSANMFADRGVLVSGYVDETNLQFPFRDLPLEGKFAESRKSIERLHPGHGKELEKPMYVGWKHIPYNEGSWIRSYLANATGAPGTGVAPSTGGPANERRAQGATNPGYETLIQADGPIYFAGDHCSHIVGWQEGAALSSLRAIGMINEKVKALRA